MYVIFALAPPSRWTTPRLAVRILRRHRAIAYRYLLVRLIRVIGRSTLYHVAVAHDGAVLQITLSGTQFWPFDAYLLAAPRLSHLYVVPTANPINLDRYWSDGYKSPWPTVLRWASCGMTKPVHNCVDITADAIRQAGYTPTRRIVSPRQLDHWLAAKGFARVDLR